jgi:hypothetical protein
MALGLTGMAKALEEQQRQPDIAALPFEERLGLLVDREAIERENKRLVSRLKFAGLRQDAAIEDLDTKAVRGLDKALFAKLAAGDKISGGRDLTSLPPALPDRSPHKGIAISWTRPLKCSNSPTSFRWGLFQEHRRPHMSNRRCRGHVREASTSDVRHTASGWVGARRAFSPTIASWVPCAPCPKHM